MPNLLGVNIAVSDYRQVVEKCTAWARERESYAVFFAAVHQVMEGHEQAAFLAKLNRADMVNPDGMPVVWALKALGESGASRVYGPDATVELLRAAQQNRIPIGFYGGSEETLSRLLVKVQERYPGIEIVFAMSPPFRALTPDEDADVVERISQSGARFLFVGLGCPKQENWIIDHLQRIPAVMLGVGAAFDFLAGTKPQAPRWMMRSGLEWTFRLASKPRRLARRYFKYNPKFVALVFRQLAQRMLPGTR